MMSKSVPSAEFVFNQRYRMTRYLRLTAFLLLAAAAVWYWHSIVSELQWWLSRLRSYDYFSPEDRDLYFSGRPRFDFRVIMGTDGYIHAFLAVALTLLIFQRPIARWIVPRKIPAAAFETSSLVPWRKYALEKRFRVDRWLRISIAFVVAGVGIYSINTMVSAILDWSDPTHSLAFPFLQTMIPIVPALVLLLLRDWLTRRLVPLPKAECPECRHSLRGLREPRCSECGIELPEEWVDLKEERDGSESDASNDAAEA